MSSFQDDLFRLIQNSKEGIDPFSSSEEDAGKDVQLAIEFANKWDYKDKFEEIKAKLEENTKRFERDRQDLTLKGILAVVRDVMPCLDDAYNLKKYVGDNPSLKVGVDMMIANLERVFTSREGGVINPETGTKFDPQYHTALTAEPVVSADFKTKVLPGTYVLKVLRPGYQVMNKVIRPAEVHVLVMS